jgi:hypothetical protein
LRIQTLAGGLKRKTPEIDSNAPIDTISRSVKSKISNVDSDITQPSKAPLNTKTTKSKEPEEDSNKASNSETSIPKPDNIGSRNEKRAREKVIRVALKVKELPAYKNEEMADIEKLVDMAMKVNSFYMFFCCAFFGLYIGLFHINVNSIRVNR